MSLSIEEKREKMEEIRNELIALKESPLYKYRNKNKYLPVVGDGNLDADILFIGEAPGKNEAEMGQPFCGRSGKVLEEMLSSIKLNRNDVYITNIVKDRPEENRDPTDEEIKLYFPFLVRQIEIIKPKVIVTLGRFSMLYIMEKFGVEKKFLLISEAHGKEFVVKSSAGKTIITIIPSYHPAVALYNGSNRKTLLQDFEVLKKYI